MTKTKQVFEGRGEENGEGRKWNGNQEQNWRNILD